MSQELTKEIIKQLIESKGEVKGAVFETDKNYVLEKEGKAGLEKLKKKAKKLGLNIPYERSKAMEWYSVGLRVISLLLIKETFDWSNSEIRKMGYEAPKTSFMVKLLLKFFVSFKKGVKETPKYWREHYTIGTLESIVEDEKTKKTIAHLKDIKIHPILCLYLEGYFEKIYEFIIGEKVKCKETKCMFKNSSYHEYICLLAREVSKKDFLKKGRPKEKLKI